MYVPRRFRILFILMSTLLACGFVVGCGATQSGSTNNGGAPLTTSGPALHINIDAYRWVYNTPARMCQALMVADVTVGSKEASHWNTPNGVLPSAMVKTVRAVTQGGYYIYTPVLFNKMNIHLDHRHNKAAREYVTMGGQVGPDTYTVDDAPQLAIGKRYLVVFTAGVVPETPTFDETSLIVYDAFPIDSNGTVTLQAAGPANEPGPGTPQPAITMPLSQILGQLASCK